MPKWEKIHASLEDIFDYGSKQESKDIQDLKLFGLYKDEKRDVRHNVYHPIDYVSNDVRIVIGEFDSLEHLKRFRPDNSRVAKELDRDKNVSLMKIKFPIMETLFIQILFSRIGITLNFPSKIEKEKQFKVPACKEKRVQNPAMYLMALN